MTTYLDAARHTATWLIDVAERTPEGWYWVEKPGVAKVEAGVGWGTGGPSLFFVELYRTAGDDRWLEPTLEAEGWMGAHLDELSREWAGCGLLTGVGGWPVFAAELATATGDDGHRELGRRTVELIASRATRDQDGLHWHGYTEMLWGTSGIGCLLLRQGRDVLGDRAVNMAVEAGDWVLRQAAPVGPDGLRWTIGPAYDAEHPDPLRYIPGFAHGAAGIGFFLARLAEVTGEQRFARAARKAANWIVSTARSEGGILHAYHHQPGGEDVYSCGWCYGPPGLGWLFRQLDILDPDPKWRDLTRAAARADTTSGIPEQRFPGFWDNVARCCGSAGVAEWFLDLHALEGGEEDLAFARRMVDDLLTRAIRDERGMRWSNYEHRNEEPHLPPEPTYLQGASGIGSTLCRLDRHLRGDRWVVGWPHAPRWT